MGANRHLVLAAVTALALSACSSGSDQATSEPSPTPSVSTTAPRRSAAPASPTTYVALGDSFTAGPGIDGQQEGAGFCQRSTRNWPSLVAAETRLELTDVSCVGATTADVASTVASGVLDGGPRLVTVGTGGNDGGLFSSLLTACTGGSDACAAFVDDQLPAILQQTTGDIAELLDTIEKTAPQADVLLVGYPRIAPQAGGCEAIGITDTRSVVTAESALDAALAAAAKRAEVTYVSLRKASPGHEACAGAEAWTNGRSGTPGDGISFHPTASGMRAVAGLVTQTALREGLSPGA